MYSQGFLKVASVSPSIHAGDAMYNVKEMITILNKTKNASFVLFPELSVCGYSIGDLIFQKYLYRDNLQAIQYLLDNNPHPGIVLLGSYVFADDAIYNCCFVIQQNKILGIVPKKYLPHSYEFAENRWFLSGAKIRMDEITLLNQTIPFGDLIFYNEDQQVQFGVEICEDYWSPQSPHEQLYGNGAIIVFNPSASPDEIGKSEKRTMLAKTASYKSNGAYVYSSNNASESTSEVVFSNHKMIAENGEIVAEVDHITLDSDMIIGDIDILRLHHIRRRKSWIKNTYDEIKKLRKIPYHLEESSNFVFEQKPQSLPFLVQEKKSLQRIIDIQATSVKKRMDYIGIKNVVLGVSGGLDSTLALLSLVHMCDRFKIDRKNILAVTLPSENTSAKTYQNALLLMDKLGVSAVEIPITEDVERQRKLIGQNKEKQDTTYENIQARFRTYTLMNLANLHQAIVIGTSDLSEIALGWATFNGDHMAMYGINSGIPKTLVRELVDFYQEKYIEVADLLKDILNTPISPELAGKFQKTEDIIGKYEVNDFILYHFWVNGDKEDRIVYLLKEVFGFDQETANQYVGNFFKRFYSQQYKRLTAPEGVKILNISLSPRSEMKMNGDIYKPN